MFEERSDMKNDGYPGMYLYKRIVQAKLFMDDHFSEPIDLGKIAETAYFSKFHFIRLFKTVYGKTPHQYLTAVRLSRAEEFLQKGSTVRDACFAVGFDSVSSFVALFRRYKKSAPADLRQKLIERQQLIKQKPLQFVPGCFAENYGWNEKSNFQEASLEK